MLDVGCGDKPYADVVRGVVTAHIGIDRADSPHGTARVDKIGTAYETGEADGCADTVLMSQVFEHLEEPFEALREAHRVLTTGGILLLSTNFSWHLHEEPRDFYRYSEHGLRYLFEKSGFEVVEIQAVTGTWFLLFQEASYAIRRAARRRTWAVAISLPATHLLQVMAIISERLTQDHGLSSGHIVVGRKIS